MQTIPNSYLSAAQSAARANAWQIFHKIGLTQEDREDVEQDILIELLEREGRYDESLASLDQQSAASGHLSSYQSTIKHDIQTLALGE